jgi:transcriptional regulator with XRE-family HTH domain
LADSRRDQLRAELMRLRMQAGLGGRPLAGRVGVTQATVSRIERGQTLPSLPVVRSWLDACRADEETRVKVLVLAEAVHTASRGWSELLDEHGHAQREFRAREASSTWVQNFQPTVVPGLLQTPEYARAVLRLGRTRDVEAGVAERVARQAVLHEAGRRFSFLLAERVLRWPVGGTEVLAAQRDRIVSLCRLPTVELAVLPDDVVTVALWSNFVIWHPADGPAFAGVEKWLGEDKVTDPGDVEMLAGVWSRLWDAAARGEDAVELIRRA